MCGVRFLKHKFVNMAPVKYRAKEKFSLNEKKELAELVEKYKVKYDKEVETLKGQTTYDFRTKKHVPKKPKQGFLATAVREFYSDLTDVRHNDPNLLSAIKLAKRCHDKLVDGGFDNEEPSKKRFRMEGGGRKCKAPEVRQAMFEWFVNVRGSLKGRLLVKMFRSKCVQVYDEWLKQQPEPIPENERLKFGKNWIRGWMEEYHVSLRKPNKKFAIKKEDREIRIKDYLKNIWTVRKYFIDKYGIDPPIINGDQMPLHRNESASQKTLSLKSEDVFVKENYMLSRERVTCFTQLCSDPKVQLKPEFVFKGKGTRTHLTPPAGVNFRWAPKGSYRIEQILDMIASLPNRFNMFTEQGFAIYVLDDYSVHLMPEVRQALFKKGYVLVVIGGGITGDVQINDTNCHHHLKTLYRDLEMKLMLEQLEKDPTKIPSPSRNEMMSMLLKAWESLQIDTKKEFKSLFVTNSFDGSEDYLVSDKLFSLVGQEMVAFRKELMSSDSSKTLKEVIRKLIPPKGVKRKSNIEGSELVDCEGEEISEKEQEVEMEEMLLEEAIPDEAVETVETTDTVDTIESNVPTNSSVLQSKLDDRLSCSTSDPDIKKDAEFLEKLNGMMSDSNTSKLFIPYLSQFKATYQKARRSIKKRIETKEKSRIEPSQLIEPNTQQDRVNVEEAPSSTPPSDNIEPMIEEQAPRPIEVPEVNQYWEISNGRDSLYGIVIQTDPFMVQYFEPNSRGDAYKLNDIKFEVFSEDFVKKVEDPKVVAVGRSRVNYVF